MENIAYQALVAGPESENEKVCVQQIQKLWTGDLPAGDVLIRVRFSSLNYKDALSATGNKGVTRSYPHTPGIDAAGVVVHSSCEKFKEGDHVIVTSYDLGMNTPGGFGQYIRVPEAWIVPMPSGLNLKESMVFGTAGFTAGMSVAKLVQSVLPEKGAILVTGATGGVGSMAAAILKHIGYEVTAVSGKKESPVLKEIGVAEVISREDFLENNSAPLLKEKWAGAVDTVGGEILATAIKSVMQDGVVTCCGNVGSFDLPMNVFPFILRGVSLLGIDSQHCPMERRMEIWRKLAEPWKFPAFEKIYQTVGLGGLICKIGGILKGEAQGRTLVDLE